MIVSRVATGQCNLMIASIMGRVMAGMLCAPGVSGQGFNYKFVGNILS